MNKLAFIFPGQGSQFVGMGKALRDQYPVARETFEEADDVLGFELKKVIFDGPADELNRTEITQPALLATAIATLRVLNEKLDIEPSFVAGHSLGEYTALVASDAMDFKDALRVVHLRGKFMQESVPGGVGKMCAVIGLEIETLIDICDLVSKDEHLAVPANINSPEQVVVSGHNEAVDRVGRIAEQRGAKRVVPLAVSVPSHCSLMASAADKLCLELMRVELRELKVPLISNVEAEPVTDSASVMWLLRRQLTSPVRWVEVVKRMKSEGVRKTLEIGPGMVLSKLVKRIDKEIDTYNFGEPGDLEKVTGLVGGSA
jgi:[acyl-carrier-protein] S-malonyltransferase